MSTGDEEVVSALGTALARRIGTKRFELWFGASGSLALVQGALRIRVPSQFHLDWIRSAFRADLEGVCAEVLGACPPLDYQIMAATESEGSSQPVSTTSAPVAAPLVETVQATLPATSPHLPQIRVRPGSSVAVVERSSSVASTAAGGDFATFVVGETNRLALTSATMVARAPGQLTPMLVHGPTGVGKTHLLQAICGAVRRSRRGARAVYLSSEQFISSFVEALRGAGLPSFRSKVRGVDLLALDDLHFFAGKRGMQTELLNTIDTLLREGRQLILAADRAASELSDLGVELVSRLQGGIACPIEPPDYATRLGIVGQLARRFGVSLQLEVQEYVASRLTNHARELSGALWRLEATRQARGLPGITLDLARDALADLIRDSRRPVGLADVEKATCDVLGLDPASLHAASKARGGTHPRMLAMYLARKHTRAALSEIGQYFGRRSHSTVISAQHRVDDWVAEGKEVDLADTRWPIETVIRKIEQRLLA